MELEETALPARFASGRDSDPGVRSERAPAAPVRAEELRAVLTSLLPRVRNLVRYLVHGDQDTDDIAQEALCTVVRRHGSYRGEAPFERWVDRIVVHTAFHWVRDRSRRRMRAASIPPPPPEGAGVDVAARLYVAERLDELPTPQRQAVVLRHVLEMSVEEIAELTEAPEETVRSRLRVGRQRLKEMDCDVIGTEDDDGH
jgi:RNA polymerase sigma-70 factor (ECF subfamily)